MPLQAPKNTSNFTPAPQGTHMARCYQLLQIGTIPEEYMGEMKELPKIRLMFELPEETKVFKEGDEPKPIVISQEYTLSMGQKANLRKLIEGMIGTTLSDGEASAFDVESLIGMPCLLNIKHNTSKKGTIYSVIASASPLMKSQKAPEQVSASKVLTYDNFDQETFNALPDFIKEKMKISSEYKEKFGLVDDVKAEEIPF